MKLIAALLIFAGIAQAQLATRWKATTGNTSISAAYKATVQVPDTSSSQVYIDSISVYCSLACDVTQVANGTAATATAGTVGPVLPTPLNVVVPVKFYTASNVGSGTDQAGSTHIPDGATVTFCLSPACGAPAQIILGPGLGTGSNYTLAIASVTATINVTFLGRTMD